MANPSGRKKGEPRPSQHNPGRTKGSDASRGACRRQEATRGETNRAQRADARRIQRLADAAEEERRLEGEKAEGHANALLTEILTGVKLHNSEPVKS